MFSTKNCKLPKTTFTSILFYFFLKYLYRIHFLIHFQKEWVNIYFWKTSLLQRLSLLVPSTQVFFCENFSTFFKTISLNISTFRKKIDLLKLPIFNSLKLELYFLDQFCTKILKLSTFLKNSTFINFASEFTKFVDFFFVLFEQNLCFSTIFLTFFKRIYQIQDWLRRLSFGKLIMVFTHNLFCVL